MMQWDRLTLGRMAKELGFPRDTLEKVCRLADVLRFMESDELFEKQLEMLEKACTSEAKDIKQIGNRYNRSRR